MRLRLVQRCRDFCDDVYGGMTALTVTVFLVMLVSVGMAVDFMRHETYRAELQDAVDRCVLAAAAFSQRIDAQTTCEGYLKSTISMILRCTAIPIVWSLHPPNSISLRTLRQMRQQILSTQ